MGIGYAVRISVEQMIKKKNLEVHHDICLQCGPDLSTVCQGYLYSNTATDQMMSF